MSTVSVFNTVGSNESFLEFDGLTKAELEVALSENNIPFKGMSFIVGETSVTLDSPQAQVPATGDWSLFLLPVEVKSGSSDEDYDDEAFSDADNDSAEYGVAVLSPVLSPATEAKIKKLMDAKDAIDEIINELKATMITDPRILALHAKAEQLKANFNRG